MSLNIILRTVTADRLLVFIHNSMIVIYFTCLLAIVTQFFQLLFCLLEATEHIIMAFPFGRGIVQFMQCYTIGHEKKSENAT